MDTAVGVWTLQLKFKTEKKRGQESIIIKIEQCWDKAFSLHGSYKSGVKSDEGRFEYLTLKLINTVFLIIISVP